MKHLSFKSMYFETTRYCNSKCKHCFIDADVNKKTNYLPLEKSRKIVDNFHHQGGTSAFITGGEPFTRPDLFSLIEIFEQKNIFYNLATNGLALNQESIDKITSLSKLNYIYTSLLGSNSEEHNEMSCCDSFDKVLENLKIFSSKNIKVVVQVTLRRGLISKQQIIADLLAPYNCGIKFTPVAHLGKKEHNIFSDKKITLHKEDYFEFLKYNAEVKEKYGKKICPHNLISYKALKYYIQACKANPLFLLSDSSLLCIDPYGEKRLFIYSDDDWVFGNALEKANVDVNDKLMNYVQALRESFKDMLAIAKTESVINWEEHLARLLKEKYAKRFFKNRISPTRTG